MTKTHIFNFCSPIHMHDSCLSLFIHPLPAHVYVRSEKSSTHAWAFLLSHPMPPCIFFPPSLSRLIQTLHKLRPKSNPSPHDRNEKSERREGKSKVSRSEWLSIPTIGERERKCFSSSRSSKLTFLGLRICLLATM